jgi:hypothetical protein
VNRGTDVPTCLQNATICSWFICFGQPVRAMARWEPSVDGLVGALSFVGDVAAPWVSDGELGVKSCRVTGFSDGFVGAILDII